MSCLCGGKDDQFPAGVNTSQAISRSASSTSGVPKLATRREQDPVPRSSTRTSLAATYRNGSRLLARALASANRPPPAAAMA